ncbi:hypothetical protein BCR43DRAFT_513084 [Syncephalastrum racemosum]|uniref:polynucleotide adenylyltransferase n=1 Tax=Syncephalastrum racemosum TaxID=13706 RepID=A0A1X2HIK8_SYNRA|nr:hypothetical protein BCR43DRAFT_513084 [Syncephalastrum racemosum]
MGDEEEFISLDDAAEGSRNFRQAASPVVSRLSNLPKRPPDFFPWLQNWDPSTIPAPLTATKMLQHEMKHVLHYLEPKPHEVKLREYLLFKLKSVIQSTFPQSEVVVFGSHATGLYLADSDIDICIRDYVETKRGLRMLERKFTEKGLCQSHQLILKAKIPIMKMVDSLTELQVDISFAKPSDPENTSVAYIKEKAAEYPVLRPLTLLLKQMLASRKLNEVFHGGLGGYAIVCMVISFLQRHPHTDLDMMENPMENIGTLFLQMIQLYGANFNFPEVGIDVEDRGRYFYKDGDGDYARSSRPVYTINDPTQWRNDLGVKSYQAEQVQEVMEIVYNNVRNKANLCQADIDDDLALPFHDRRLVSFWSVAFPIHIETRYKRSLMNLVSKKKEWRREQEFCNRFGF